MTLTLRMLHALLKHCSMLSASSICRLLCIDQRGRKASSLGRLDHGVSVTTVNVSAVNKQGFSLKEKYAQKTRASTLPEAIGSVGAMLVQSMTVKLPEASIPIDSE